MAIVTEADATRAAASRGAAIGTAATATTVARPAPAPLPRPEATQPVVVDMPQVIVLSLLHVAALAAFIPWCFSWTGVTAAIVGHFLFGMCGITIGYHRLLTHRGFVCPRWFERVLAVLGMCTLQGSPARWVAIHRVHHRESDEQPDPHSPLAGFFWGHTGWLLVRHRNLDRTGAYERYVRDLLRDRFYLEMERHDMWFFVYLAHAVALVAIGAAIGWWTGGAAEAVRLAVSMAVWGVALRTVVVLHGTWAVNSLSHTWGYRNYQTTDNSRNNWLVALLAHGEGWHNNHHADQRAAAHGHRWWELDMSWWVIRSLEAVGLVSDVVRPRAWNPARRPVTGPGAIPDAFDGDE
jgi:stearoyl-CoA desaturase (delta-9 desaturase)